MLMLKGTCADCGYTGEYLPALAGLKLKCKNCPGWIHLPGGAADLPLRCGACSFEFRAGKMAMCPQCAPPARRPSPTWPAPLVPTYRPAVPTAESDPEARSSVGFRLAGLGIVLVGLLVQGVATAANDMVPPKGPFLWLTLSSFCVGMTMLLRGRIA